MPFPYTPPPSPAYLRPAWVRALMSFAASLAALIARKNNRGELW